MDPGRAGIQQRFYLVPLLAHRTEREASRAAFPVGKHTEDGRGEGRVVCVPDLGLPLVRYQIGLQRPEGTEAP